MLCIENLPRTCLGRDSGELMRLIADYPEVMVCFDSNHLLKEEHAHFFEAVGNRIGTIHASDYDRKDERHWLPPPAGFRLQGSLHARSPRRGDRHARKHRQNL